MGPVYLVQHFESIFPGLRTGDEQVFLVSHPVPAGGVDGLAAGGGGDPRRRVVRNTVGGPPDQSYRKGLLYGLFGGVKVPQYWNQSR